MHDKNNFYKEFNTIDYAHFFSGWRYTVDKRDYEKLKLNLLLFEERDVVCVSVDDNDGDTWGDENADINGWT